MPSTHPKRTSDPRSNIPKRKGFASPNLNVRVQEKEDLSDLNNRLAAYIDRVRSLENQNAKLSVEVNQAIDTRNREVTNVKAMFETELAESRRLLDDTSKEKALLKLENNKLNGILNELRPKLDQEQLSNKQLQEKLRGVERRLNEKENLVAVYSSERAELSSRLKELELQLDDLESKLAKDKDQLEKEIIARIDAENRYQTLKEESQFTAQVHIKEVNEAREIAQSQTGVFKVESADGNTTYDGLLQDKLQELRQEFEEEAENAKQELEDAYKAKFEELKQQSEKDRIVVSKLMEKQGDMRSEVDSLKTTNSMLSSKLEGFQKRITELDNLRVLDKEEFKKQLEQSQEKLVLLQGRYDELEVEYETLLGIKIALDMELAAYNKLLEGEESRLNIQTPERSTQKKRKRFRESGDFGAPSVDSSATGSIAITEVNGSGKFVIITNLGTEDENLGGFYVHRVVDGADAENDFKFPSDYVLPSERSVTIWSESEGRTENPPDEYVLQGNWAHGGKCVETTIINTEADVIAKSLLTMSESPSSGARKLRKEDGRESCVIM